MSTSMSFRRCGPLTVRMEEDRNSVTLWAVGELDMATAPTLERSLAHAFQSQVSSIVLDLAAVSFIDGAGLRSLLWAAAMSGRDGNRLRIDCGSPVVRQLLDRTGSDPEATPWG